MRRLVVPAVAVLTLLAAPAAKADCREADAPKVPGAEAQKAACLNDLTTSGTVVTGHTNQTDWDGLNAAGTRNLSGVPGMQIDGYFPDSSRSNSNNGWLHDSQFVIRMPESWNGGLVITGAPGVRAQYANDFIISDWVLARGYAFAATDKGNVGQAFYRDGAAPGDAVAEWHRRVTELTRAAQQAVHSRYGGAVRRTYVAGISNGGYLTRYALEHHPELYDGGIDWEGTLFRAEGPSILTYLPETLRSYPSYRATGDQAAHDRIIAAGFAPGSEFLWDDHYTIYWDLTQRIYREEFDPGYDGALEAGIPFCQRGTPNCDADYDYASRPPAVKEAVAKVSLSGRIGRPMLSLHAEYDTLLPIRNDGRVYDALVRRAGRAPNHRFYEIGKGNHVDDRYERFPESLRPILPCQRAAFQALEAWVDGGRTPPPDQFVAKPTQGDVVNECALAGHPGAAYTGSLVPAPGRCLARSARFGRSGVGRVRIGWARSRVRRRAGAATSARGRRARYCVTGGGDVIVAFSRRGRAGGVATTAPKHRARRGLRPGASARTVRRRYRGARPVRGAGAGVYRSGRILFAVRGGNVRYVAAVGPRVARSPRLLRSYLRLLGLGA